MLHYFQGTYRSKDVLCRAKGSLVGGHLVDNLKCEFDYFRFPNSIEHCLIEWVRLGWIWFAWLRLVPEKEFAQSSVFDFVGLPNPIELNPLIEFDWVRFPNVRLTVTGSGKLNVFPALLWQSTECRFSPLPKQEKGSAYLAYCYRYVDINENWKQRFYETETKFLDKVVIP